MAPVDPRIESLKSTMFPSSEFLFQEALDQILHVGVPSPGKSAAIMPLEPSVTAGSSVASPQLTLAGEQEWSAGVRLARKGASHAESKLLEWSIRRAKGL